MSITTLFPSIFIGLYVFSRESPTSSSADCFSDFQASTMAPGNGTPSSRLVRTTRRIRRRYKPNNRNPPPNTVPNRGKPTPAPFIATHLQNLRRQRPDLLKREIVRDARIARVDLYRAVAPVVVDGVRRLGGQLGVPAYEEVLDLAVVGERADRVEREAAAVDIGFRAVRARVPALDDADGARWWWEWVYVCACAVV